MGIKSCLLLVLAVSLVACDALESRDQTPPAIRTATPQATFAAPGSSTPHEQSWTSIAPPSPTPWPTTELQVNSYSSPTFFPASDERIRYNGRFDFSDPLRPAFDWSGVSIEIAFSGTAVKLFLEDGRNLYNVTIDGQKQILATAREKNVYAIAEELPPGEHRLRLTKRTEAYVGAAVFSGFEVTGDLLPLPALLTRRIEFIGDSITAGYGNEGAEPDCWFTPDTENAELSYAALVADQLNADYSLVALSGLGVARNMRDARAASAETAIDFVDRALAMNPTVIWPPDRNVPAAVVINLGTNDFSSVPFPDDADFVDAYLELLTAVHARYPQAQLFAVAGPLMLQPAPRLIEQAVTEFRRTVDNELASYVLIEDNLERSAADFGCDWHPNVHGHGKIAVQLAPVIADRMGW